MSSATSPRTGALDTTVPAAGPRDPAANLRNLVVGSTPELRHVQVVCPSLTNPPRYPFYCSLDAEDRVNRAAVSGGIRVVGVYPPTRSYAFELTYALGHGG
jgi:hypothetical protein